MCCVERRVSRSLRSVTSAGCSTSNGAALSATRQTRCVRERARLRCSGCRAIPAVRDTHDDGEGLTALQSVLSLVLVHGARRSAPLSQVGAIRARRFFEMTRETHTAEAMTTTVLGSFWS